MKLVSNYIRFYWWIVKTHLGTQDIQMLFLDISRNNFRETSHYVTSSVQHKALKIELCISFVLYILFYCPYLWSSGTNGSPMIIKHHPVDLRHPIFLLSSFSDMPLDDLEESVIDMLACRWERTLGGSENLLKRQLVENLEEFYLGRYTDEDRKKVREIIHQISLALD